MPIKKEARKYIIQTLGLAKWALFMARKRVIKMACVSKIFFKKKDIFKTLETDNNEIQMRYL